MCEVFFELVLDVYLLAAASLIYFPRPERLAAMQDTGPSSSLAASRASKTGFRNFDHGAADVILAAEFNSSGTHLAVCSADHKIRLFAIGQEDAWILMDQWRGHDAEILDASSLDLPALCMY